jgi:hypothetical protein
MTQLTWCPVQTDLGGLAGCSEFPPDVGRVQGGACPSSKDKIVVVPPRAGRSAGCERPLLPLRARVAEVVVLAARRAGRYRSREGTGPGDALVSGA